MTKQKLTNEDIRRMVFIAYQLSKPKKFSQKRLAEIMGIREGEFTKLKERASEEGFFTTTLTIPERYKDMVRDYYRDYELAAEIQERYGVHRCTVIDDKNIKDKLWVRDLVYKAAAEELKSILIRGPIRKGKKSYRPTTRRHKLGVGWGYSVYQTIEELSFDQNIETLARSFKKLEIFPILGSFSPFNREEWEIEVKKKNDVYVDKNYDEKQIMERYEDVIRHSANSNARRLAVQKLFQVAPRPILNMAAVNCDRDALKKATETLTSDKTYNYLFGKSLISGKPEGEIIKTDTLITGIGAKKLPEMQMQGIPVSVNDERLVGDISGLLFQEGGKEYRLKDRKRTVVGLTLGHIKAIYDKHVADWADGSDKKFPVGAGVFVVATSAEKSLAMKTLLEAKYINEIVIDGELARGLL